MNRDLATVIVAAAAGSWFGYLLFTGMPQFTLHVFPRTLALHLVVAGAALVYVIALAATRRLPGGTPLDAGVFAIVGAFALATYASVSWRASLEWTLQFSIALIAFYVLADLPLLTATALRRAFMLAGGALALYALWVVGNDYADYLRLASEVEGLGRDNIFPATVPRVHDVSDHPNVLAMVLVLLLPFFALAAYTGGGPAAHARRWERLLGFAGLVAAGWAIFLTLSRGGWLGAAAGIALTLVGAWLTLRIAARESDGRPVGWDTFLPSGFSPTALAAVGGALALAVFGTLAFLANSSTRPGWLFRSSLSPRQDAWEVGREIFGDNLLLGAGPNTFGLLYPQRSENAARFIVHTQHAHNGFLQVADDAGLVGLGAVALLIATVAYMLWRIWRSGTLEQRLVAVACAGALTGFAVHNQLDAGNLWKAPAVTLAVVGAIIARTYREAWPTLMAHGPATSNPTASRRTPAFPEPVRTYGGVLARGALLALLFVPFAAWYRIDRAHNDYYVGLNRLNQGSPGALERLQDAVDADSSMMPYQLQLGIAQASVFDAGGREQRVLIENAIIHLERAAALDPRSDLAHANLARAYQLAGRDDEAAAEANLTRLAVYHVAPVLLAGEVYENLGRDDDAISTYGQVLSMDAGLANSTFWEQTPFRSDHFDEILAASTIGINPCTNGAYIVEARRSEAADIPIREGDSPAEASAVAPASTRQQLGELAERCKYLLFTGGLGNDLVLRVNLAKILLELGEREEARGHLQYAIDRQPDFGPARTEFGRHFALDGDLDGARHQWVVGGQLGEAESVRLLGDSYAPAEVPGEISDRLEELLKTSGSSIQNDIVSVLYYRMRYGRLSPVFALIPGDWATAVPRPYAEMREALARWRAAAPD